MHPKLSSTIFFVYFDRAQFQLITVLVGYLALYAKIGKCECKNDEMPKIESVFFLFQLNQMFLIVSRILKLIFTAVTLYLFAE